MLELGSAVLIVGEVYGFARIVVDIVDVAEEDDFKELIDFGISALLSQFVLILDLSSYLQWCC